MIVGVVAGSLGPALLAGPAHASFPGRNGKIAFARDQSGGSTVDLMSADGASPKRIARSGDDAPAPSWSPDGSLIAFSTDRHQSAFDSQIYVMNADGSNQHALTDEDGVIDRHPTWQPLE